MLTFEDMRDEDLREVYGLCERTFRESPCFEEVERTYLKCKGDSHYRFLVGRLDGRIVAYTTIVMFYDVFDGDSPIMTLWYVCVDEAYRRRGIASAMFKEIERIAEEAGCELIYFTSKADNKAAHAFYRSAGYSMKAEKAFVKYLYESWNKDDA